MLMQKSDHTSQLLWSVTAYCKRKLQVERGEKASYVGWQRQGMTAVICQFLSTYGDTAKIN